jgi:hypothetical protein
MVTANGHSHNGAGHTHDDGHQHDEREEFHIAHIRHGEMAVLIGVDGQPREDLLKAEPDGQGNWPPLAPNARAALSRWLKSASEGAHTSITANPANGRTDQRQSDTSVSLLEGSAGPNAPFLKANGSLQELLPLGPWKDKDGEVRGTLALYTVNLQTWIGNPWIADNYLETSITDVAKAVRFLNDCIGSNGCPQLQNEAGPLPYYIVGFAPSWLGASSNACACGGPGGGEAVNPTKEDVERRRFQPEDVAETVNQALENVREHVTVARVSGSGRQGEGVTVAIIDSWPVREDSHDFFAAVSDKVDELVLARKDESARRLNDVLSAVRLGGYRNLIHSEPEEAICIHRHGCNKTLHSPNFADHGLFIAGLVHEVAPKAKIRFYRAFNAAGCSSWQLVAKAVCLAVHDARKSETPLVINCSFSVGPETYMLNELVRGNGGSGRWKDAYYDGRSWIQEVRGNIPSFERVQERAHADQQREAATIMDAPETWFKTYGTEAYLALKEARPVPVDELEGKYTKMWDEVRDLPEMAALRSLFTPLWEGTVLAVAAAGNDSCRDEYLVAPPRFPAAFNEVLGVSAVVPTEPTGRGSWEPAPYSNNDDVQKMRDDAVSAMGGVDPGYGQNPLRSLLGPYVSGDLKEGEQKVNRYGHALWAGTSYATPIVAGLAACVWSEVCASSAGGSVIGKDILRAIVGPVDLGNPDWTPGYEGRLIRLLQRDTNGGGGTSAQLTAAASA